MRTIRFYQERLESLGSLSEGFCKYVSNKCPLESSSGLVLVMPFIGILSSPLNLHGQRIRTARHRKIHDEGGEGKMESHAWIWSSSLHTGRSKTYAACSPLRQYMIRSSVSWTPQHGARVQQPPDQAIPLLLMLVR